MRGNEIYHDWRKAVQIVWIKGLSEMNTFTDTYLGYVTGASLEHAYGEVCLIAEVHPAKERL